MGGDSLTKILQYLQLNFGINLSVFDANFIDNLINKRITETNCGSFEEYAEFITHNTDEAKKLIDSIQVGYSEFFRNPLTFAVLEQIVLPELVTKKCSSGSNEIRIWSSACAAGQEAYSVAILLEELKKGTDPKFDYRIFATDLSPSVLKEAQVGRFYPSTLKNVSLKRTEQWFKKEVHQYTVLPDLKRNIDFSVFDLLDKDTGCPAASIYGSFDLVFCANLLFYYHPRQRKFILDKITNCIAQGGYLVTGETERGFVIKSGFNEVFPNSAILRK